MSLQLGGLLCRVCLEQEESWKVDLKDGHSKYLGQECTNELLIAAKFRKKCAEAKKRLKDKASREHLDMEEPLHADEIISLDPSDFIEMLQSATEDCKAKRTEVTNNNCQICGAVFQQSAALCFHMLKVHASISTYECELRFFTDLSGLKSHMRCRPGAGAQVKRYRCPKSGKWLQSFSSLAANMRQHSEERPFACDLCPKTFKTNGSLMVHWGLHRCKVCDKTFSRAGQLCKHEMRQGASQ
ncbi:zinc finger protein 470 [Drosophila ficusphila]|uniref:zinc finger protein 470 n=1 Tax=Drosophila ficusphila TaxID=30025 RepID=UPI0007E812B2|nr:zinc finger protein 470 [Drosophila ficusphila]